MRFAARPMPARSATPAFRASSDTSAASSSSPIRAPGALPSAAAMRERSAASGISAQAPPRVAGGTRGAWLATRIGNDPDGAGRRSPGTA